MNIETLEKMRQMKFYGMHSAFQSALETGKLNDFTTDQLIAHLVSSEHDERHNRKINRHIANAKFRYQSDLEKIQYDSSRKLDRNRITRLAQCDFIDKGENILITGSTEVGKSYLASALGHNACSKGYKVLYFNTAKFLTKLKMAKVDDSYLKETAKIERQNLFILDDLGLQTMDNQSRMILMDIIKNRHAKSSLIITSQLPIANWHEIIGEKTIADAIMDRIVHNAHRIELEGESMRKNNRN
ncbi:MAG: ATP-binding protein [Flavobacteriales bacterium]|nr:ATP-binding protein [Flavobacteriales bacterium]